MYTKREVTDGDDEAVELEEVLQDVPELATRHSSQPNKGVPCLSYRARLLQRNEPATWVEIEQMPAT